MDEYESERGLTRVLQDTTLWIHIFINMFAYGVIFPIGMVLGVRSTLFMDNVCDRQLC